MITEEQQPSAYDFVAGWHEKQAATFLEISRDEPRVDAAARARAADAARHHNGSAAALRTKAHFIRRSRIVPFSFGTKTEQER